MYEERETTLMRYLDGGSLQRSRMFFHYGLAVVWVLCFLAFPRFVLAPWLAGEFSPY